MNAPTLHRKLLKRHLAVIEEHYPLRFAGVLPRGSAGHVPQTDEAAIEFLADKSPGLTLILLAEAEAELGEMLGRTVGIVLRSSLIGDEAQTLPALAEAL